jgi:hypothetical protein
VHKIPSDEALNRALETSSLTYHGSPFHAVLVIDQPGEADSIFKGSIEIYWADAKKYRIAVKSKTFQQTRIVNGDKIKEQNIGDFYPVWLRNYVRALLDPLPRAQEFRERKTPVMLAKNVSSSCINRDDRPSGVTDQMTWASICFQGSEPRIRSAQDFTYSMDFEDYKPFGKKQIARSYVDYFDGDKVVGQLTNLEPLSSIDETLFSVEHTTPPEQRIETNFVSMATNGSLLEKAPSIEWPPIREGKTEGNMIVHILTDRTGQVREAYRHNSDTPGLEDFGRLQALKYKFKPLVVNGVPQQMETPLVLHFTTKIGGVQLPVLTGDQIKQVMSGCAYNPILPKGLMPSGSSFKIRASINEQGKLTGESYPSGVPEAALDAAEIHFWECSFKPYLINGQPWYYYIDFVFTAP